MKVLLFISLFFSICSKSLAEYRVYQYGIIQKDSTQNIVLSSLNPVSYRAFHGGQDIVKLSLLRTWMCPGYTGRKQYCASPYSKIAEFDKITKENE